MMTTCRALCRTAVWLASFSAAGLAAQEVGLRVDLVEPAASASSQQGDLLTETIRVTEGTDSVDIELSVVLEAAIEPCASNPADCGGGENFLEDYCSEVAPTFGCSDGVDNDSDGVADSEDPDCRGVEAWSFSIAVDPSFGPCDGDSVFPCDDPATCCATTAGTVGDACDNPPGLRDASGSFETTDIVDPATNGGQPGAVSTVLLSFLNPIIGLQVGEAVVLTYRGSLDVSGLGPGERTEPCVIRVLGPEEQGLVGQGQAVPTRITVGQESLHPAVRNLALVVEVVDSTPPVISCPGAMSIDCPDVDNPGATVEFTATASDNFDSSPTVVCVPASGSFFPAGTTTVTCTATDAAGNESTCDFDVTVNCVDDRLLFLRGDCDADGSVPGSVNDAVANFQHCFTGRALTCLAACDTDGDGNACTGVTDGLLILLWVFRGGAPLASPFPDCGRSDRPGDVGLGCEQSGCQ